MSAVRLLSQDTPARRTYARPGPARIKAAGAEHTAGFNDTRPAIADFLSLSKTTS